MTPGRLRVVTVLGTRPEIIRLSRVTPLLDEATDHRVVHTGQNYDQSLNGVFYTELGLRPPDHHLGINTDSLGAALGGILSGIEPVLMEHRPDALLVLGDTNSSLAAIVAKRMRITVYHMEAGNRCFDENVPEEVNRRIVDHVADFNLAYTEHARRHLLAEGLHPRRVYVTGSPLREVLSHYRPQIESSDVLAQLGPEPGQFFLVSIHRAENVDDPDHLSSLVATLNLLCRRFALPVIVSTHPRTRQRLAARPHDIVDRQVRFHDPFGFFDYNALQCAASCVLSDSGSVGEESAILSFPAVTVRNSMERPEAMETGGLMLTGLDPQAVARCVEATISQHARGLTPVAPNDYAIGNCSQRVVNLILGTAGISRIWAGLAEPLVSVHRGGPEAGDA